MNAPPALAPRIATPPEHFVANRWTKPATGATLPMLDPSTGDTLARIARGTAPDVDAAVLMKGPAAIVFEGEWQVAPTLR